MSELSDLLLAVDADPNLSSLRERVTAVDGSEAHRIIPQVWPSIKAILALSDLAKARAALTQDN